VLPLAGAAGALVLIAALVLGWRMLTRSSPPELHSVAPTQIQPGQTLTLTGNNFARDARANSVLFGSARAVAATASATELKVVVPRGAAGVVQVAVMTTAGRSPALPVTVLATADITDIEPEVAMPGQRILIHGDGFSGRKVSVQIAGIPSTSVETTPEGVRALVPEVGLPEGSKTPVLVQAGTEPARAFDLLIGRLPLVLAVRPETGPAGQVVTLEGRGFDPDPGLNSVTFAGEPALVLSASRTKLDVVVPTAPADGAPEVLVVVRAGGRTSSSRTGFRPARNASAGFRPRFFPAAVAEYPGAPMAFVSTELGPVLLLAGGAASASVADRAVAVAAALNALVESAARPPLFEVREAPQPSVAVVGEARPLLTPTADDVAAYGRPWDGNRNAARRVTPAALARHWAVLLQDYLGLFLFRERPLQMLMLSPRGRVLAEIHAEASRRSPGERTVPSRVVLPLQSGWAGALRQLALVVGGDGGRTAAVVEGAWQGSIDDPERGTRAFNAQLRSDAGRLAGTLTTWAGAVELRSALRELGFERGSLRFTADLQGAPHRFSGTLEGETVSGTVERPGKPPLRFSMRFVE
jgi:hypothetical protein